MKWLSYAVPTVACSMLLACDAPTAPGGLTPARPALDKGGSPNAACFPVRFHSTKEWFVDQITVAGTFTGDVQGSFVVQFDPSTLRLAGQTDRFLGTGSITISGGSLPITYPLTFTTAFRQKNLEHVTPVSPATIFEQIVTLRATSGVTAANLSMHGNFDAVTTMVNHDWWGVICP